MKSDWTNIVAKTTEKLFENGIKLEFREPPQHGRHVKSKAVAGLSWGFARAKDNLWIELELSPRNKEPQADLYEQLKSHRLFLHEKYGRPFVWDEADRKQTDKRSDRRYFRIKSYINSYNSSVRAVEDECVDCMVKFILSFYSLQNRENISQ